ncbi:MAG: PAS domain-containing protein [Fuerstiella sp.]
MFGQHTKHELKSLIRDCESFVRLVQVCSNGIAICLRGTIVRANPALASLLGVSHSDGLTGQPLVSILSGASSEVAVRKLEEMLLANLADATSCDVQLLRQDGSILNVDASVFKIEFSGSCDCMIVFRPGAGFRGGPGRKWEELIQLAGVQRLAIFGELAASLFHDLGQPITAAKGASEILAEELVSVQLQPRGLQSLSILMGSMGAISGKFKNIWDFVRARQPDIQEVSVNSTVANAVNLVVGAARHAGATVKFSPGKVTFFKVDVGFVELVLTSLLRRSILSFNSASVTTKRIKVTTAQLFASQVEIVIEHNGAALTDMEDGLPSIQSETMFDHWTLSTCRTIVEQNHGIFSVEPRDANHGIRYRVIFPIWRK